MSRKAIDVVLLPSEAMMNEAVEVNAELVEKFGSKIVLNKESCLPHISLAMGCMREEDITEVGKVLRKIAKKYSLGNLKIVGVAVSTNSVGEKVSVFVVEKTRQLQLLHQEVMEQLAEYLSYDVTADMLYPGEGIAESTLLWIKNYREKSSFAKFLPHITIGYGQIEKPPPVTGFAVSKLALCHLGNHCTCREIIAEVELMGG